MTERTRRNRDFDDGHVLPWEPLPGRPNAALVGTETEERPKRPTLYLPDGTPLSRHRPFGFRPPVKR